MAPSDLIGAALAEASDGQLVRVLQVLTRAATDRDPFAHVVREALDHQLPELVERAASCDHPGVQLPEALSLAVASLRPGTGAVAAMAALPTVTEPLIDLTSMVLLTAAQTLETTAASGGDELLSERAQAHDGLARVFGMRDQHGWGVAAGERAVQIYGQLVERYGQAYAEDLAVALNNLSVSLHETGQAEKSLSVSDRAADLFRRLTETEGKAYLPGLANALANLSVCLAEVGRDDEALAAAGEAVSILRELAGAEDGKQADLAWVLHNLSIRLAACGYGTEAVEAIEEAIRIRRDLARPGQNRHLASLASSLNSYSLRLDTVGRHADALTATDEAVRILRELVKTDPDRYLPALATSLNNLSDDLAHAGQSAAAALAASAEAVQIRRGLARAQPDRFRPHLAAALHNLSVSLAATGQGSQALDVIREAAAIRRSLAASRPHLYGGDLARSLRNLSIRLAAAGRPAEAADAARESADTFRSLAERRPEEFRPELATSLSTLSIRLGEVDCHEESLAAVEECVQLRRALAADAPGAYLPQLAIALNNLSVVLSRAGQAQRALVTAEEAVQIRRTLAAARPNRYAADLASSLNTLAVDLGDAGRHPEALPALQAAVRLLWSLAASNPRAVLPDLVMSVSNLAEQLGALGRNAEAGQLFTQILTEHGGDTWATGVILRRRASWHADGGNLAAAITDTRDAIDLLHADESARAKARRFLRDLREADPGRFDSAWDDERGTQPTWLRHLQPDRSITGQVHRWLGLGKTLEEEQAFLAGYPQLTTEEAEAVLDHLIDDNPGNLWLHIHQDLIRTARAHGVEVAYAEHRAYLWHEGVSKALAAWVGAAEEALQGMLAQEGVLLLSAEAESQAETMLAASTRTPDLLWRIGLLILCRHDGPEAAFQTTGDPSRIRRAPGRRALTDFEPRDLALARLRAGHDPDDPEAAFIHAVLALSVGHTSEAEEAITRCAETSTSWNRRTIATYLTELTAIRPDLAGGLALLRSTMAASDHPSAPARSP